MSTRSTLCNSFKPEIKWPFLTCLLICKHNFYFPVAKCEKCVVCHYYLEVTSSRYTYLFQNKYDQVLSRGSSSFNHNRHWKIQFPPTTCWSESIPVCFFAYTAPRQHSVSSWGRRRGRHSCRIFRSTLLSRAVVPAHEDTGCLNRNILFQLKITISMRSIHTCRRSLNVAFLIW